MHIFGWSNMSSEIGRYNIYRMLFIQIGHYTKLFQFRLQIQSITTLSLYGRHSHVEHFIQTLITRFPQLFKIT